jgi:hypothetical protein
MLTNKNTSSLIKKHITEQSVADQHPGVALFAGGQLESRKNLPSDLLEHEAPFTEVQQRNRNLLQWNLDRQYAVMADLEHGIAAEQELLRDLSEETMRLKRELQLYAHGTLESRRLFYRIELAEENRRQLEESLRNLLRHQMEVDKHIRMLQTMLVDKAWLRNVRFDAAEHRLMKHTH